MHTIITIVQQGVIKAVGCDLLLLVHMYIIITTAIVVTCKEPESNINTSGYCPQQASSVSDCRVLSIAYSNNQLVIYIAFLLLHGH